MHDNLEKENIDFNPNFKKITRMRKVSINSIMGISGGLDSSTLLYCAVKNGI